jgi:hypothetical protein
LSVITQTNQVFASVNVPTDLLEKIFKRAKELGNDKIIFFFLSFFIFHYFKMFTNSWIHKMIQNFWSDSQLFEIFLGLLNKNNFLHFINAYIEHVDLRGIHSVGDDDIFVIAKRCHQLKSLKLNSFVTQDSLEYLFQ